LPNRCVRRQSGATRDRRKSPAASLWFRSIEGALRTIAGYEAMNVIRKGQIRLEVEARQLLPGVRQRVFDGASVPRQGASLGAV
jgi:hypothetical protein